MTSYTSNMQGKLEQLACVPEPRCMKPLSYDLFIHAAVKDSLKEVTCLYLPWYKKALNDTFFCMCPVLKA